MRNRLAIIFFLIVLSFQAGAQVHDPVKWTYTAKYISKNTYDLIITAKIDKGWHMYSQHEYDPTKLSPNALFFEFNKDDASYELVGKTLEKPAPKEEYDKAFELNVYEFENKATFTQRIKLLKPITSVSGKVSYQACKEICVNQTKKFTISLPASGNSGAIPEKETDSKLVQKTDSGKDIKTTHEIGTTNVGTHIKWAYDIKQLTEKTYELKVTGDIDKDFHLVADNSAAGNHAPVITLTGGDSFRLSGDLTTMGKTISMTNPDGSAYKAFENHVVFTQKIEMLKKAGSIHGKVVFNLCAEKKCYPAISSDFGVELPKDKIIVSQGDQPLSAVFWLGFIGGLFALLTPCVFPMIPLTISFFTKRSEDKSSGVGKAILFGVSIIVIYVGLGLLISVAFGPQALKNLASNVYTNLIFFAVFTIFAFSFLGAFDITLPASWANKADERAEKGGIIGIFFIALTLAIVSFSCTSPIVSELLILGANGGGYAGPTIGMLGFSLAWAIPFTVFAMFPTLMQKLPKSGGWLNSVKVCLGFIELALALKFLSTADLTYNWGLLKREYFLSLWIMIFGMMGFYLLGKLRFSHDSPTTHISVTRLMIALLSLSFALYMVPGLWGAPVKLLSGIAPPSTYSEWIHDEPAATPTTGNISGADDKPRKYQDLFKSPHGLKAYYDFTEGLQAAKVAHKPIMIDFTGHACTNCRLMEENVWSNPKALSILKNDYVLVSLYGDDKHDLKPEEVYNSKISGDKIATIGDKWSDFEISRYNTNAMPYYILLDNNENILARSTGYDSNVDHFISFLEKGKADFK